MVLQLHADVVFDVAVDANVEWIMFFAAALVHRAILYVSEAVGALGASCDRQLLQGTTSWTVALVVGAQGFLIQFFVLRKLLLVSFGEHGIDHLNCYQLGVVILDCQRVEKRLAVLA